MSAVKFRHGLWNKMCAQVAMALPTKADMSLAVATGSVTCYFWKVKICVKGLVCLEQQCCLYIVSSVLKDYILPAGKGTYLGKISPLAHSKLETK